MSGYKSKSQNIKYRFALNVVCYPHLYFRYFEHLRHNSKFISNKSASFASDVCCSFGSSVGNRSIPDCWISSNDSWNTLSISICLLESFWSEDKSFNCRQRGSKVVVHIMSSDKLGKRVRNSRNPLFQILLHVRDGFLNILARTESICPYTIIHDNFCYLSS